MEIPRSSFSRTTRLAWGKTAPRINLSSNWRHCGQSRILICRPGDANEVVEAWKIMQFQHQPALLVLTRQTSPTLDRTEYASAAGVAKGAYILADAPDGKPEVILIASGSEVSLCVDAYEKLKTEGINARVVSMPSWEIFSIKMRHTGKAFARRRSRPECRWKRPQKLAGNSMWVEGTNDRHATFRRFGSVERFAEEIWIHPEKQWLWRRAKRSRKIVNLTFDQP